ncbi:hypothetical protein F5I97DRAFT_2024075 [Phlebopus sp. FC_14]|nr:hypothetical protein F5I97DRAFT_2024075 [Phlebopus sp. FC_14]
MSLAPSPSAARGRVIIQPAYFTSSAFVHAVREDIDSLIQLYGASYANARSTPFSLFKNLWISQGWIWIHFRVFDARSRDAFFTVIMRLFSERIATTEDPFQQVIALFGLYMVYHTQPSASAPALYSIKHLQVTSDIYDAIMSLPNVLDNAYLAPLLPHAIYVLSSLLQLQFFHILPQSSTHPLSPRELPREVLVVDSAETMSATGAPTPAGLEPTKRKGRLSKREKITMARHSLDSLDKWLNRTESTYRPLHTSGSTKPTAPVTTHALLSRSPIVTRDYYRAQKLQLLNGIDSCYQDGATTSQDNAARVALDRANHAVAARMRKIDEEAAKQGLEVGGEGGERTGLQRVERAVDELGRTTAAGGRGGILGLLEGAGIGDGGG